MKNSAKGLLLKIHTSTGLKMLGGTGVGGLSRSAALDIL